MRIAVVIPAHNEVALIATCLRSIAIAACRAIAHGHLVRTYVVCDACTDGTERAVVSAGLAPLVIDARNVGEVRAYGARVALADGADWLAFTDADTEVTATWLLDQIALDAQAFCGTVQVGDWGPYGAPMARHFARTYFDIDGHRHIHGANLGLSASAYRACGGFASLENSEDVDLVRSLERCGVVIAWSNRPRVTTSARPDYRASGGFGATLAAVASLQSAIVLDGAADELDAAHGAAASEPDLCRTAID